jgi:predicted transcriptional regulator
MEQRYNDNTKLSELTVGELRDLVRAVVSESVQQKRTVAGLSGLADLLGVSESTVKRYRSLLSPAIAQRGRSIVVDADRALKLWAGKRNF